MYVLGNKGKGIYLRKGANRYSQMKLVTDLQQARTWPTKVGPAQTLYSLEHYRSGEKFLKEAGIKLSDLYPIPVVITFKKQADAKGAN
jgi:hypothetical protein